MNDVHSIISQPVFFEASMTVPLYRLKAPERNKAGRTHIPTSETPTSHERSESFMSHNVARRVLAVIGLPSHPTTHLDEKLNFGPTRVAHLRLPMHETLNERGDRRKHTQKVTL